MNCKKERVKGGPCLCVCAWPWQTKDKGGGLPSAQAEACAGTGHDHGCDTAACLSGGKRVHKMSRTKARF